MQEFKVFLEINLVIFGQCRFGRVIFTDALKLLHSFQHHKSLNVMDLIFFMLEKFKEG